jgi:hypothetical protein
LAEKFKKMRSGGNRNSVILSRMIKARFSSFVCPVAPYVSYFSFTSCQWLVVFYCMLPNGPGYGKCGILKPLSCPPTVNLFSCNTFIYKQSARICYSRCWCLLFF